MAATTTVRETTSQLSFDHSSWTATIVLAAVGVVVGVQLDQDRRETMRRSPRE